MKSPVTAGLLVGALLAPSWGLAATPSGPDEPETPSPARRLAASLPHPLADLAGEVLDRNPDLARARREAEAAALRAPQVGSLPDPVASLTPFLSAPETRIGPQQVAVALSQRFPWFGKLALRERAVVYDAAALRAEAEARALTLVTETRRLYYELAFLDAQEEAVRTDLATLQHYEELARARYASGVGLEQAVVKLQAEITKDDNRLLDIESRRAALRAELDALRDQRETQPLPSLRLPEVDRPALDPTALRNAALARRPEIAAARARIAAAETRSDLAEKNYYPDVTLGLHYTLVGRRDDAAGRANPPQGNGDDVVGLSAGINLPVWRRRLDSAVEEAAQRELAAQDALRTVSVGIDATLGDLVHRIPLSAQQYELFDEVLTVQSEEALRSAEAAYSAGSLGALDLLDAERVVLEVHVAAARTLADLAIAMARLEGAIAAPATSLDATQVTPSPAAPTTGAADAAQLTLPTSTAH